MYKVLAVAVLCSLAIIPPVGAAQREKIPGLEYTRQADVIYGRKHGVALTMDVLFPKKQNGAAIIYAVSSGFNSHHSWIEGTRFAKNMSMLLDRGYTVFLVVHGSTPKFTIRENYADIRRSIRFIRYNAKSYGIDPKRIGMSGASAGGVISLMMAAAPQEGDPKARDPIERESTRLQAVGCFYPASDLVNFHKEGENVLKIAAANRHLGSYQFRDHDPKTNSYTLITDPKRIHQLLVDNSPITHVSKGDTPTLIVHGEKDRLVPLLQASKMVDALKAVGVKSKLVVAKGKGHSWRDQWTNEMKHIADWFDERLAPAKK
ncbi:MAG: prolyl oligopeptidase family serine peptidase [Phycisphaerales bacterium]|jgi:acetyl esterase/lipase|nr:prolyl oligopeptidase family serine peptidase [Phycisphaerales bacterium]